MSSYVSPSSPQSHFQVIYADPPWLYRNWSRSGTSARPEPVRRGRSVPYPCLTTADICALPVHDLCAPDCVLFLRATYPMVPDALAVVGAWGFRYKSVDCTWVKTNPSGTGFAYGLGHWTRANPEICLLATRGQPKRVSKAVPNLVTSPRREQSRKPDEVRERIVALCGEVPWVELFARQKVPGWRAWGNQVPSDLVLGTASRCRQRARGQY